MRDINLKALFAGMLIPVLLLAVLMSGPVLRKADADSFGKFDTIEITNGTITFPAGTGMTVGSATTDTTTITGILILGAGLRLPTATAVSLTSPTTTFSAAGKGRISLTSDANLTGVRPTGGTLNQVILIESGAGSNTMRFDDGTSLPLGGNITLTEAQGDVLALICTTQDGDEWKRLFNADN